mgnify:FL=1
MIQAAFTFATVVAVSFFFSSCQQSPKKNLSISEDTPSTGAASTPVTASLPPLKIKSGYPDGGVLIAKPLTSAGVNHDARFSKDGTRLLFVSRERPTHRQAQVYELHLEFMREKRVTFHDGDDHSPVYTPDGKHLLFVSETDEIKEEPLVSQRMMKVYYPEGYKPDLAESPFPPAEIYRQSLHGRTIERLTHSRGFDGDVDIDPKGARLLYSSARVPNAQHLYLREGKITRALTSGKVFDRGARFSPDGRSIVWAREIREEKGSRSQLMLATAPHFTNKRTLVTSDTGRSIQPDWHPSGEWIVFSSNRDGGPYNLYVTNRAGSCVRRLTVAEFDQLYPAFHPDGKQLAFTSPYEGKSQIYLMDFRLPDDCP